VRRTSIHAASGVVMGWSVVLNPPVPGRSAWLDGVSARDACVPLRYILDLQCQFGRHGDITPDLPVSTAHRLRRSRDPVHSRPSRRGCWPSMASRSSENCISALRPPAVERTGCRLSPWSASPTRTPARNVIVSRPTESTVLEYITNLHASIRIPRSHLPGSEG
jgi:hypothetical protein